MKKLYFPLIILILFSFLGYSQNISNNNIFSLPSPSSKSSLSKTEQNRLEAFNKNSNYIDIKVLKVENIRQELNNDKISLDLFNGMKDMIVSKQSLEITSDKDFLYSGEIDGGGMVILQRKNDIVSGNIRKDGRVFDIEYLENDMVAIIEYDMKKIRSHQCGVQEDENDKLTKEESLHKGSNEGKSESGESSKSAPWVDVLVLFTPAAAATGRNMTTLANTARSQWLSTQQKSYVRPNLRIARVQQFNFIENRNNNNILQDVRSLSNNVQVQQLRNNFAADIVILITRGSYPGILGVVPEIGPRNESAYGIVQVDAATSDFTMIHEIGHLFGARHEFSEDNTPGDAHGHQWKEGWWPLENVTIR